MYELLFTIIKLGFIYSVCAVVWITLIAGLCQLIRGKIHQIRPVQKKAQQWLPSHQISYQ